MEGERERHTHRAPKEDEWPENLRWGEGERERLINGMERKISKKKKKKREESKEKKERKRESEKPFNSSESLMANSIMSMLGKMLLILFQNQ